MSQQLQLRRNPWSLVSGFVPAQGECVVDTTNYRIIVGDGVTAGGWPAARLNDVSRIAYLVRGLNLAIAVGDTQVPIVLPTGMELFRVLEVIVGNPSAIPVAAELGLYTAAAQGGTAIASQQVLTGITSHAQNTAGNCLPLTLNSATTTTFNVGTLYLNIGTPNVASMTVDVEIVIAPLS